MIKRHQDSESNKDAKKQKRTSPTVQTFSDLHYAAMQGDIDKIKELVGSGADVNEKNNYGVTPLHCAAREGQKKTIKTLLDLEASLNTKDSKNRTPIYYAANYNRVDIVNYLVEFNPQINVEYPTDLRKNGNNCESSVRILELALQEQPPYSDKNIKERKKIVDSYYEEQAYTIAVSRKKNGLENSMKSWLENFENQKWVKENLSCSSFLK